MIKLLLLTTMTFFGGYTYAQQKCANLSHYKVLKGMNIVIHYKIIDCKKLEKTFIDFETKKVMTTKSHNISRVWETSQEVKNSKRIIKRTRFYWNPTFNSLIEDFYIEGNSLIASKLQNFYRSKSRIYSLDKEHEDQVKIKIIESFHNEYLNGTVQADAKKRIKYYYKSVPQ